MKRIGVLTSGGDSPGMNAAIRAVVRVGLDLGADVVGVREGYEGLLQGGAMIAPLSWLGVSGILQQGGTILGTARSQAFRTPEGRAKAVRNLVDHGIEGLVVIGGDGSLSGAHVLYDEFPTHLATLAAAGHEPALAWGSRRFHIVGLPGSIDNDLYGTDMSIGADTALQTVVRSLDQLVSTASAHQRTFVIEVMGRNCGYLALMSAIATGGDWVMIPEEELEPRWHQRMAESLRAGRRMGRRHEMVIFAEGARHTDGLPIGSDEIQRILAARLEADVRVTVLGHVQRGGSPSAFDRTLATRLGAAAVQHLVAATEETVPAMVGLVRNAAHATPLREVVEKSRAVQRHLDESRYSDALGLRNRAFREALALLKTLSSAQPTAPGPESPAIAVVTGDADAPGMNGAIRTVVRTALSRGYRVLGVVGGFRGLVDGAFRPLEWMTVSGWARRGGTELGASRYELGPGEAARIAEHLRARQVAGLICLGSWETYRQANGLAGAQAGGAALDIPIVCVPATIDNSLPGTDFTIGADTALNSIVEAIDKVKYAAVATHRAFIVEVMGRDCGYLALLGALATGAERAYLPEDGIRLAALGHDVVELREGFSRGKTIGIVIRSEHASQQYDTDFVRRVLEVEGEGEFEARTAVLGHLQRGGTPSPFDRILAARLGALAATTVIDQLRENRQEAVAIGVGPTGIAAMPLAEACALGVPHADRPREQWWYALKGLAETLAQPGPGWRAAG